MIACLPIEPQAFDDCLWSERLVLNCFKHAVLSSFIHLDTIARILSLRSVSETEHTSREEMNWIMLWTLFLIIERYYQSAINLQMIEKVYKEKKWKWILK